MAGHEMDLFTGTPTGTSGGENVDPDVQLSEDLLQDYQNSYRATWTQEAVDDDAFRTNVQWKPEDEKLLREARQFPIVINYVHRGVELAKALLTSRHPRFASSAREDSDLRTGSIFSDLLSYIWYISKGNRELKRVIDDYYVRGMGVMMVYHDPIADGGKGEVYIRAIDPFDVYVSPDTQDQFGLDTPHFLVVKSYSKAQFTWAYPMFSHMLDDPHCRRESINRHPQTSYQPTENQQVGKTPDMSQDYYEVIDRYSRIKHRTSTVMDYATHTDRVCETDDEIRAELSRPAYVQISRSAPEPVYITKPEAVAAMMEAERNLGTLFHYVQDPETGSPLPVSGPETDDPSAIPNSETVIQKVTMGDMVDMGVAEVVSTWSDRILRVMSVGGVLMDKRVLPCEDFPVVCLMNHQSRNPYPGSDVRKVRPLQEAINKIESLLITHVANATNVKVFVPEGAIDEKQLRERWGKAGAQFFTYDGSLGAVTVAGPVPLPQEAFMMKGNLKSDIEDILGIYAMMQGDVGSAPDTFRGTMILEEYGQRRMRTKQDDVEEFLNQVARVVVQFIQKTYTTHKVFRLVQPYPTDPRVAEINIPLYNEYTNEEIGKINDVTVGRYDIQVVSGSMMPTNRWARMELYMQMYEKGVIDSIEVLKQTDVVDQVGVLQRMNALKQAQQQIEMLQAQVKQLSGDLQTAQRESVQDRKRVEVEKFKSALKGVQNKAEYAATLFQQRAGDELSKLQDLRKEEESGIGEGVVEGEGE